MDLDMSIEGIDKLVSRVQSVIQTSRECNEVTVSELIGALELIKMDTYMDEREGDEDI